MKNKKILFSALMLSLMISGCRVESSSSINNSSTSSSYITSTSSSSSVFKGYVDFLEAFSNTVYYGLQLDSEENKDRYLEFYLETAFKKKAHMYNVPGFRKGRAPRSLIEKMYGDSIFWNDAMEIAIINEGKRKLKLLGLDSNEYPSVSLSTADRVNGITADVEYISLI